MPERLQEHFEHHEPERSKEQAESHSKGPEQEAASEKHRPSVESLKHHAKQEAISKDKISVGEQHEPAGQHQSHYVNKELKSLTFNRTLARVRRHLGKPNKILSKVVHQPTVEVASRVGEKTIARPVSLLTGSVFAFVGTTFAFYMSKHYGFRYNFLLFALFFAGGFIVGLALELLLALFHWRTLKK